MEPAGPPPEDAARQPWRARVLWLVVYWLLGVAVVAAAAYALRWVMGIAGLRL